MANNDGRRTIKMSGKLVEILDRYKKATSVPISRFVDMAVNERIERMGNVKNSEMAKLLKK